MEPTLAKTQENKHSNENENSALSADCTGYIFRHFHFMPKNTLKETERLKYTQIVTKNRILCYIVILLYIDLEFIFSINSSND